MIVIPWPRVPVLTPGGKVSKAKNAGRLIPWLSTNTVNNLPKPVYRNHKIAWRDSVWQATGPTKWSWPWEIPVEMTVTLYKATASLMDPLAVLEGLKPIVDGLEARGLLANDRLVVGGRAQAVKAESLDACRVELELRAVES